MKQGRTVEDSIERRIKRSGRRVYLRQDFSDLGGYSQVGRALKRLVEREVLLHMGYGLYARTRRSVIDGEPIPEKPLPELAREAVERLGHEVVPTKAETDYNERRSTQVPTGRVIGVRGRVSRKISRNGNRIQYERQP